MTQLVCYASLRFIVHVAGPQEYSKAERLDLAKRSRTEPPIFGSADRQRLTRELHERLLARQAVRSLPQPQSPPSEAL